MKINGIILEGCDGSGKSTLKKVFNKLTDKKWFVLDRGPGSAIAYGMHNKRKIDYDKLLDMDDMFAINDFVLVYLNANRIDIRNRETMKGDGDIKFAEIDDICKKYQQYLVMTKMPIIKVNTSTSGPEETAKYLLKELKKLGTNAYEKRTSKRTK